MTAFLESLLHDPMPVLLPVLAITMIWFIRRTLSRRVPRVLMACGAINLLFSLLITGVGAAHIIGVLGRRILLKVSGQVPGEPELTYLGIHYDFRLYGLILMGVVILFQSVPWMGAAPGLARQSQRAWKRAIRSITWIAVTVVPLLPLQPVFAKAFLGFSAVCLFTLWVARKRFPQRVSAYDRAVTLAQRPGSSNFKPAYPFSPLQNRRLPL